MKGRLEKLKGGGGYRIVIETGKDPSTGKRRRIIRSLIGRTRPQAEEEFADFMKWLAAGTQPGADKVPLAEYLRDWFAAHSPNLAPSTEISYKMIIENHLIPALGMIPLAKLQPLQIQGYYAQAMERLSPRTVQYHHAVLHRALRQAVKWRIIGTNPVDAVDAPRPRRKEMRALKAEEVAHLLAVAEGHRDRAIIHTALCTGLRRGEILALRWGDVDLARQMLAIRRSMLYIEGKPVFREPKTAKGRRQIMIPQASVTILKEQRKKVLQDRLRLGPGYQDNGLVFCAEDGSPLNPDDLTRRFMNLAAKAGFAGFRFHDLRHTHATLLLTQGHHPKVVQERLGHQTISVTLDTYSHVLPTLQEAVAEGLDQMLGTKMAPKSQKTAIGGDEK